MQKKIKISSSISATIATGSYQNLKPSFAWEEEFDGTFSDTEIKERINNLHNNCMNMIKNVESVAIIDRIQRERQDMRFYDGLPSVTSVLNWDSDFFIPPHELQQYASQGNLYHAQAEHYIKTGKWLPAKEIEGTWADLVILSKGSLKLSINGWDFPEFLKKHPLEKMEVGKPVKSEKHKFGGTPDVRKCFYKGKKTLADFKRTVDKTKGFKQIAAYILAEEETGESPYDQMMLIPANAKTEQGFSKPVIMEGRDKIKGYQSIFLRDRENFKKRYGI